MSNKERFLDQVYLNYVLNGRTTHTEVLLPARVVDEQVFIKRGVVPAFLSPEARQEERRAGFVPVRTDSFRTIYSRVEERSTLISGSSETEEEVQEEQPLQTFTEAGLVLGTDFEKILRDEDEGRRTARESQRIKQHRNLLNVIRECEDELDGDMEDVDREYLFRLTPKFKAIAESWYNNEISQEPQAKESVDQIYESRSLDDAVSIAEEYLKDQWLDEKEILSIAEYTLRHPVKKVKGEKKLKTDEELEEAKRLREGEKKFESEEEKEAKKARQAAKMAIEHGLKEKRKNDAKAEMRDWGLTKKIEETGVVRPYDPELDEPSPRAAAFVQEMMERQF